MKHPEQQQRVVVAVRAHAKVEGARLRVQREPVVRPELGRLAAAGVELVQRPGLGLGLGLGLGFGFGFGLGLGLGLGLRLRLRLRLG